MTAATRTELLQRQRDKLEAELSALKTRAVELARNEQVAREQAIQRAPSKRSDGGTSEVARIRRKWKEAEAGIANIEAELQALSAVLGAEEEKAADERFKEVVRQAEKL